VTNARLALLGLCLAMVGVGGSAAVMVASLRRLPLPCPTWAPLTLACLGGALSLWAAVRAVRAARAARRALADEVRRRP